jgi:outer membrane immunogenic protein
VKIILAVIAVVAFGLVEAAHAAPKTLPVQSPPPATPSWTGFYIGGHFGKGWEGQGSSAVSDPAAIFDIPIPLASQLRSSAYLGGAQLGYNYQFAPNFLVGAEIDGTWTRLSASQTLVLPPSEGLPDTVFHSALNTNWLASVRGRIGYIWADNLLAYVTGGAAWGGFSYNANVICPVTTCAQPFGLAAPGADRAIDGTWVLGGGAEWRPIGRNWSFGVQYLYYGFDTVHNFPGTQHQITTGIIPSFGTCSAAPCPLPYSVRDSAIQVVSARINWLFP